MPATHCHYPVPRVSVSLSCTPNVSVIILYPECQCHYPVPRVSVSLSCTPRDKLLSEPTIPLDERSAEPKVHMCGDVGRNS
ncbi:unnamed protein product [Ranitomeya imitator]|uniref:Uncharacterized protein n=1 Tax=Ranitomeya imitator TaxID=111125 RepID=A0ABN9MLL2_9NEOB|nr:unnamed protein product [Ranitomeya imitator]